MCRAKTKEGFAPPSPRARGPSPAEARDQSLSEKTVSAESLESDRVHCLILGGPGSGKTMLLKRLALRKAQSEHVFPVYCDLRSIRFDRDNLLNVIFEASIRRTPTGMVSALRQHYENSLAQGRVAFFLDGLDEISSAAAGPFTVTFFAAVALGRIGDDRAVAPLAALARRSSDAPLFSEWPIDALAKIDSAAAVHAPRELWQRDNNEGRRRILQNNVLRPSTTRLDAGEIPCGNLTLHCRSTLSTRSLTTASHGSTAAGTATTPSRRKFGPNWATGSESPLTERLMVTSAECER